MDFFDDILVIDLLREGLEHLWDYHLNGLFHSILAVSDDPGLKRENGIQKDIRVRDLGGDLGIDVLPECGWRVQVRKAFDLLDEEVDVERGRLLLLLPLVLVLSCVIRDVVLRQPFTSQKELFLGQDELSEELVRVHSEELGIIFISNSASVVGLPNQVANSVPLNQ